MISRKRKAVFILAFSFIFAFSIKDKSANAMSIPKKVTVNVGSTKTVKLKGNKSPFASWSVSNGKIRIVKMSKNSVKIKGMKKGTAYLIVNNSGRTAKCKVTVKLKKEKQADSTSRNSNFNAEKAKENISRETFVANGYLYAKLESDYGVPTSISAKCTFYNDNGVAVDYDSDSIGYLEGGYVGYLEFLLPSQVYSTYKIEYEYTEGMKYFYHSSLIEDLSLTTNYVKDDYGDYLMITVTNGSNKDCYYCEVATVYYNDAGEPIAVSKSSLGDIKSGSSDTQKSSIPYDRNTYDDMYYAYYETNISYAYHMGRD